MLFTTSVLVARTEMTCSHKVWESLLNLRRQGALRFKDQRPSSFFRDKRNHFDNFGQFFFFLKLTTDAPGLMEGNFFLSAIGFGLLSPAPKLYSEIKLTVLFSTGMFLVGVSGVLSSLGLVISKDKIATPRGGIVSPKGGVPCEQWPRAQIS